MYVGKKGGWGGGGQVDSVIRTFVSERMPAYGGWSHEMEYIPVGLSCGDVVHQYHLHKEAWGETRVIVANPQARQYTQVVALGWRTQ